MLGLSSLQRFLRSRRTSVMMCGVLGCASLAACSGSGASAPAAAVAPAPQTVGEAVPGVARTQAVVTMGAFTIADAVSGDTPTAPLSLAWQNGAPAAGDVLVACVESQYGNAPQAPAGWTALSSSATGFGTALFYRVAASGESTTVSFGLPTARNVAASMVRVIGASGAKPLFSHAANASATIATAPIVPTTSGLLPIACFGAVGSGAQSVAAGWTLGSQYASTYASISAERAPTTDASTPVTVTATDATTPLQNDAYAVLLAPGTTPAPTPTPAPAPPAALSTADAASGATSASPLVLPWTKGAPASGDLLVACVEGQYANAPIAPAGWTALVDGGSSFGTALFYKIAAAGEPSSVSFGIPTPYNIAAAMVRITGAAATAPQWSHAGPSGGTAITTAGLVPATASMLPIGCFGGLGSGKRSLPAPWTIDSQPAAGGYAVAVAHAPQTTTSAAVTVTATGATSAVVNDAYELLAAPAPASVPANGVSLAPSAIGFLSTSAAPIVVGASQSGASTFTIGASTCANVATIAATSANSFSVAPVNVGSCSVTINGSGGATGTLAVTTTSTVLTIK